MPPAKQKPSEIAAEAKKTYIPWIRDHFSAQFPPTSTLCYSDYIINPTWPYPQLDTRFGAESLTLNSSCNLLSDLSPAFLDRDPVDAAIEWYVGPPQQAEPLRIPVIMPANDKRPGGDWEAGMGYLLRFASVSVLIVFLQVSCHQKNAFAGAVTSMPH